MQDETNLSHFADVYHLLTRHQIALYIIGAIIIFGILFAIGKYGSRNDGRKPHG
jgi:hypothetical protein